MILGDPVSLIRMAGWLLPNDWVECFDAVGIPAHSLIVKDDFTRE